MTSGHMYDFSQKIPLCKKRNGEDGLGKFDSTAQTGIQKVEDEKCARRKIHPIVIEFVKIFIEFPMAIVNLYQSTLKLNSWTPLVLRLQRFANLEAQAQAALNSKNHEAKSSLGNVRPTPENKPNKAAPNYCIDFVRKHDYENFLCTLLLPDPRIRSGIFAVRALNAEVAMVRDQVTQKELGMGRMFFWRDAVNQAFLRKQSKSTNVPKHPVVIECSKVIMENEVSKKWFTNLLDSREKIMTDAPFSDLADLESYCDQSVTSLLYLALELYGVKNMDVDHAASHLGKAIGLASFIRSIPFNAQRRIVLVPRQLLIKHQVSQENLVRNNASEKIHELTYELACQAHSHYEKAKSLQKKIPKPGRPVFLYGVPSLQYLKRLEKVNFNPYDPSLHRRDGLLPFRLFMKKLARSYY